MSGSFTDLETSVSALVIAALVGASGILPQRCFPHLPIRWGRYPMGIDQRAPQKARVGVQSNPKATPSVFHQPQPSQKDIFCPLSSLALLFLVMKVTRDGC